MVRLLIDYCNCTLEIYIIVPASRKHSSKLICCDALNTGEIISTVLPNLTRDIYIHTYVRRIGDNVILYAVLIKSCKGNFHHFARIIISVLSLFRKMEIHLTGRSFELSYDINKIWSNLSMDRCV